MTFFKIFFSLFKAKALGLKAEKAKTVEDAANAEIAEIMKNIGTKFFFKAVDFKGILYCTIPNCNFH